MVESGNIQLSIYTHPQVFPMGSAHNYCVLRVLIFLSPPSKKPHSPSAGSGESAASLPNTTKSFPVVSCREENDQG